jgi:hypothetical protein
MILFFYHRNQVTIRYDEATMRVKSIGSLIPKPRPLPDEPEK